MQTAAIGPARAAELADRLLAILLETKEVVSHGPHAGQFDRIRDLLVAAKTAVDEAVTIPPSRGDGKETSISRQGILVAVEGEIALLARLKVSLGLHLTRGDALSPPDLPRRTFVSVAVVVRSLLATPTLDPRLEVRDVDDTADPFRGT